MAAQLHVGVDPGIGSHHVVIQLPVEDLHQEREEILGSIGQSPEDSPPLM